jgi:hypothetical protein
LIYHHPKESEPSDAFKTVCRNGDIRQPSNQVLFFFSSGMNWKSLGPFQQDAQLEDYLFEIIVICK